MFTPSINARLPAILGLFLTIGCSSCVVAEPVAIANSSVGLDAVSLNTARLVFSHQLAQWPNGTEVRVFVLPDNHNVHRTFAKHTLSLYPRQLRRVWDRQVYTGTGQAPETVANEQEMLYRIATTPGAVGYLSSEMIDETVHKLSVR